MRPLGSHSSWPANPPVIVDPPSHASSVTRITEVKPSSARGLTPPLGQEALNGGGHDVAPQILRMYRRVLAEPRSVDAVAQLAQAMANSGSARRVDRKSADIASTGGPSSLSTLLCPLYLVGGGLDVPKVGVPGRPAGGVDVLGTLRGYRSTLSIDEVDGCIAEAGYVHIRADATWAPADAALFRLRQQEGTQAVPALAVASILAKKVAAGVGVAGLEGRIAPFGNFGDSIEAGRRNAMLYCRVALALGLEPIVILTDARVPFQPYIGRGEALTALWKVVTHDLADAPWLAEHAALCMAMAMAVANRSSGLSSAGRQPVEVVSTHLNAQGTSMSELVRRVEETSAQQFRTLVAGADGFVQYDLGRIRTALGEIAEVEKPKTADVESDFDDPAGVRLLCPPGQRVRVGEPVMELRYASGWPDRLTSGLFVICDEAGPRTNVIMEVISQ